MRRDPIAGFRDPLTRIDVTPFIGVAMVLLMIAFVVHPAITACGLKEPRAHTSAEMRRGMVTVGVDERGKIFVEGAAPFGPVRGEQLTRALGEALIALPEERRGTVYLLADQDAEYSAVLSVLDAAADNGVRRVGLVTRPPRL